MTKTHIAPNKFYSSLLDNRDAQVSSNVMLYDIIQKLKTAKSHQDLTNILSASVYLLNDSMLWLFLDKKLSRVSYEASINIPQHIQIDFRRMCVDTCDKCCDDEVFARNHHSLNWRVLSFGLSLSYERHACFLFMRSQKNLAAEKLLHGHCIIPYALSAYNNVLHYEENQQGNETKLSARQQEIALWMAQGKTNKEIAMILNVSQFTVKNHIAMIYEKLNVVNRAQAIEKLMRLECL